MAKTTDGFVRLPNWLIDDSDLSAHELLVYTVLLRFRNPKTGKCFPGMTTIADMARISRDSVKRTIPKLEAKGMIKVTKQKDGTRNLPNVYDVALANETPEFIWASSMRGRRVPRRRRSEHPPLEEVPVGRCSEHPPRRSEHPGVGAGSASKKTKGTRSNEQAVTPTFGESGHEWFSFDQTEDDRATEQQVAYLKDLAIHLGYETGGGIPNDLQMQRWRKLTRAEADKQIRGYKKALGAPDSIYYPDAGTPEYDALTTAGKEFADTAGQPDSVWAYGWMGKENSA